MNDVTALPSGTVTFLFTDIEGSTRLWEQQPKAMRSALSRHDALAAATIARHAGTLVKSRGEGDSLFAVFARASDALAAASALQQALLTEPWPTLTPLRVRMALHTGEADRRDGDYYGPAVNRCARLRAIAHGGQVLLSLATEEVVREALPEGASLLDRGRCRLQDLSQPEQVFQLVHPHLPADFPPLRSLEVLPNNLPLQLTRFIGREQEMASVRQHLVTSRLVTLTGAGGCGKTRLALQVAADVLEGFADGIWLVELAALSDPTLVPQTVATVLGMREEAERPLVETLVECLRSKHLLLVLDNCEHLLSACAGLAEELLRRCPNLRVLASSREALGIGGEQTYRVPSLAAPDPRHLPSLNRLQQYEAVRLFTDRAVLSQPTFAVTAANAPAMAQICHRLDGIPLAIELAAARVKALPVEQIAARLDDRFRLLTSGSRTALPRQQTLRALIDWSYDLLSEPERTLLRRLSVFAGGWTLKEAEAVCTGDGIEKWEVLDLLARLVEKSLVLYEERAGDARYRLLETVRQYARDWLRESGDGAALAKRHRDSFLHLAEAARRQLNGPEQGTWLERLETEHDNLRTALEWSVEQGETTVALRFGNALGLFWYYRGHLAEGWRRMAELLSLANTDLESDDAARAQALTMGAVLAGSLGDHSAARSLAEESLALWQELGNQLNAAGALNLLASEAFCHGDLELAHSLYLQSLSIRRELGNKTEVASSLLGLGHVARMRDDFESAHSLYEESLSLGQEQNHQGIIAWSLSNLGLVSLRQGDHSAADARIRESLAIWWKQERPVAVARCLELLAQVAFAQGSCQRMARLFGAAEALRETILYSVPLVDRDVYDDVPMARSILGEEAFAAAWAEGRTMSPQQAVGYALEDPSDA